MTDIMGNALNMQYSLLLPEILLAFTAFVVVFADLFSAELKIGYRLLPLLTVAGLVAALLTSLIFVDTTDNFSMLITVDAFTTSSASLPKRPGCIAAAPSPSPSSSALTSTSRRTSTTPASSSPSCSSRRLAPPSWPARRTS